MNSRTETDQCFDFEVDGDTWVVADDGDWGGSAWILCKNPVEVVR